ncbi:MAG: biotin/lipoyl-binding protein [Dethiobacter sp.]|jgi:glutaconyl-CoA decarboxylase|nr:biotin/lipoyl-binding protein [Dethiobacter sp.]
MKKFKVTVDGQVYEVLVEEVQGSSSAPQITPLEIKTASPAGKKLEAEKSLPQAPPVPRGSSGGAVVSSPMPGSIVSMKVQVGDRVAAGDLLLILEAMKMENEVVAPFSGIVVEIMAKNGAAVNSGEPLLAIG